MREAARLQQEEIQPGWDLIWIARRGMGDADLHQVMRSVRALLRRAGLLEAGQQEVVEKAD